VNSNSIVKSSLNIPNFLSVFRIIAAPVLLCLAWSGLANSFLALFAASLISDCIDGWIARRFDCASELGTKLDSWGDLATYMIVPLCAWWLWPDIIKREISSVLITVCAYTVPILAGLIKFRRIPTYHTWAAKTAAVVMGVSAMVLFIFDISWPFRSAAVFQALVACEEIAITLKLSELQNNVSSLWHVISPGKR
jgi:CDP-diacylglycerol--glycerol-3-phosphate 3-phosphatidyltransferase